MAGWLQLRDAAADDHPGRLQAIAPDRRANSESRTAFYYAYTMDSPGMIMRVPKVGSQYLIGFKCRQELLRRCEDLQGDAAAEDSG